MKNHTLLLLPIVFSLITVCPARSAVAKNENVNLSEGNRKPDSTSCDNAPFTWKYSCANSKGEKVSMVRRSDCKRTTHTTVNGKPLAGATNFYDMYLGEEPESWLKLMPPENGTMAVTPALRVIMQAQDKNDIYICDRMDGDF